MAVHSFLDQNGQPSMEKIAYAHAQNVLQFHETIAELSSQRMFFLLTSYYYSLYKLHFIYTYNCLYTSCINKFYMQFNHLHNVNIFSSTTLSLFTQSLCSWTS